MAWSYGFKSSLRSGTIAPSYRLRFDTISQFGTINITSATKKAAIALDGPTINGQRVQPTSWNVTFGGFTVPIVGNISTFFPSIRKGSFAELYCTINGKEERITCGQLRNIKKTGNRFIFEFVDLITALGCRYDISTGAGTAAFPDPYPLFYRTNIETFPTSIFTGASGSFPTQLPLNDIRFFEKENGKNGVVRCVPASGEEYYLLWSSKTITSGNQGYLTLAHTYTPTSKIYPTIFPPTTLQTSDKVYSAQYLVGYPSDIIAKILLSEDGTGTGLQTYPVEMNSGISLGADFFDQIDADSHKQYLNGPAGTLYDIGLVIKSPMTQGLRGLITEFGKAGHWPVWRQNAITYRGCSNLLKSNFRVAANITDNDIFGVRNHDFFSPDQHSTFRKTGIKYANREGITDIRTVSTLSGSASSLPVQSTNERDSTDLYGPDPFTSLSARLDLADGDIQRMRIWDIFPYEKITLECQIKFSQLCCGDVVNLSSDILYGLNQAGSQSTYKNTKALVIGVDYNISTGVSFLTLAIPFQSAGL